MTIAFIHKVKDSKSLFNYLLYSLITVFFLTHKSTYAFELKVSGGVIKNSNNLVCRIHAQTSQKILIKEKFKNIKKILVEVGDKVKDKQAIAKVSNKDLEKKLTLALKTKKDAQDSYKETKTQLEDTDLEYERKIILLKNGTISKNELKQTKIKKDSLEITLRKQEVILEREKTKVDEIRNDLKFGGYMSSMTGIVTSLLRSANSTSGSIIAQTDDQLAKIDSFPKYQLICHTFDNIAIKLKNKAFGYFKILGDKVKRKCRVDSIEPVTPGKDNNSASNKTRGIFEVKCNFEEKETILREGLPAILSFKTHTDKRVKTLLPWEALHLTPKEAFVYVKDEKANITKKKVTLGMRGDYKVEIKEGLSLNDTVLINK